MTFCCPSCGFIIVHECICCVSNLKCVACSAEEQIFSTANGVTDRNKYGLGVCLCWPCLDYLLHRQDLFSLLYLHFYRVMIASCSVGLARCLMRLNRTCYLKRCLLKNNWWSLQLCKKLMLYRCVFGWMFTVFSSFCRMQPSDWIAGSINFQGARIFIILIINPTIFFFMCVYRCSDYTFSLQHCLPALPCYFFYLHLYLCSVYTFIMLLFVSLLKTLF